jgi:hypothetical protein
MRMKKILGACVLALCVAASAAAQVTIETADLRLRLNPRGQVTSLFNATHNRELLAAGQTAPLLQIRVGARVEAPATLDWNPGTREATIAFNPSGARVWVKATATPTHLTLAIVRVEPAGLVDAVTWGPYPVTIGEIVGEVIGVVRDQTLAFGLQVLNIKTLGGIPAHDEGSDMSRSRVAQAAPWGSVLQAYALDRSRPRRVSGWTGQFPNMPVAPIPGETVVGSSIALFAAPVEQTLARIGQIEVAEGLPHPTIDGVWVKQWPDLGRSYLIAAYTESTVDELLAYTKRANLLSLYHPEPFASWGHYELDAKSFPAGDAGMREAVRKAQALGIRLGVHTLTNFINTNDPYVTPVPDPRLSRTGESALTGDLDAAATSIPVAAPEYFANEKANWLHTVVIDQELIRYRAVSAAAPWTLLDCERGAFGTRAAAHRKDATVGKLLDHPYKVFYPTIEMQDEIASRLAAWFNKTGVSHMDFDGHEGGLGTGQGDYAIERFAQVFYDGLDHPVLNGTSNSEPFYWHINTYCNWGEPWYGGFRESMQEYRLQNQALFERNFIPHMLGWYRLTATTSLSEMEWMLARAAGHNAGFAMSTTLRELQTNGDTGILLDAIREWETARRAGAFSASQRERLKNSAREFHLEAIGAGTWNLFPFHASPVLRHDRVVRQPGEPTASTWDLTNPDGAQPIQFRLLVVGAAGSISKVRFELDGTATMELPVELNAGESVACDGTPVLRVYDAKGRQTGTVTLKTLPPQLAPGRHRLSVDASFAGDGDVRIEVTVTTRGPAERVGRSLPQATTEAGAR